MATREITVCDVCGKEIFGSELHVIKVNIGHSSDGHRNSDDYEHLDLCTEHCNQMQWDIDKITRKHAQAYSHVNEQQAAIAWVIIHKDKYKK
jgi:hypothetical protein